MALKIFTIIIIGIVLIFLGSQLYLSYGTSKIETYSYNLLKKEGNIELRKYEAGLFTSVTLPNGKYEESSRKGFRVLAGYIFGKNDKQQKIAMTSPVSMSLEDSMKMMFMVPTEYDKEDLPQPLSEDISFVEVPSKKMAAIRYGGWSSNERIESYKLELVNYLKKQGISHTNNFYYFAYNPPYEIFNRRNEILVELD